MATLREKRAGVAGRRLEGRWLMMMMMIQGGCVPCRDLMQTVGRFGHRGDRGHQPTRCGAELGTHKFTETIVASRHCE